jgi:hypothetical protein
MDRTVFANFHDRTIVEESSRERTEGKNHDSFLESQGNHREKTARKDGLRIENRI